MHRDLDLRYSPPWPWLDSRLPALVSKVFSAIPGAKSYKRSEVAVALRAEVGAAAPAEPAGLAPRDIEVIRLVSYTTEVLIVVALFTVLMGFAIGTISSARWMGQWPELAGPVRIIRFLAFSAAIGDTLLLVYLIGKLTSRSLRAIGTPEQKGPNGTE